MSANKIQLTKNDESVLFTFTDSKHYLTGNGRIEVPLNSLSLVIDSSDMVTFRKAASNDIFVSAPISDFGMSKAELEDWYADNMVGGTGGGIDPETLAELVSSAEYVSSSSTIDFKNVDGEVISTINAEPFITDGMVDNVQISGSNLVITFNVDAGKQPISIPLSSIFNPENYYDKSATDTLLNGKVAVSDYNTYTANTNTALSGKADTSAVTAAIDAVNASLSGKADVSAVTAVADALDDYATLQDLEDTEEVIAQSINSLNNVPPLPLYIPSEEGTDGGFIEVCLDKWTILSVSQNMEGYEEDDVHFEFRIETMDEENYWVQVLKDGSFKYYDANPTKGSANELSPDDVPFYGYTVNNIPALDIYGGYVFTKALTFYALLKDEYYDENDECIPFNVYANFYDDGGYLSVYYDDADGYIYRSLRETLLMMNATLSSRIYQAMDASANKVDQWTFNTYTANTNTALSQKVSNSTFNTYTANTNTALSNKADASAVTAISGAVSGMTVDYDEAQRVTAIALIDLNERKQDTLIAGSGITISGNVISADGGGSITIDPTLDSGSTNAVANSAITAAIDAVNTSLSGKADASDVYTKTEIDNMIGDIETLLQAI